LHVGQPKVSPDAGKLPIIRSRRAFPVSRAGRADDEIVLGYSPSHADRRIGASSKVPY
jgi:hypothetical protein